MFSHFWRKNSRIRDQSRPRINELHRDMCSQVRNGVSNDSRPCPYAMQAPHVTRSQGTRARRRGDYYTPRSLGVLALSAVLFTR
jgi:hypothetical protein